MKTTLNKGIIAIALALILFNTFEISWLLFSGSFLMIWLLAIINFRFFENYSFYKSLLLLSFSMIVLLMISKYIDSGVIVESYLEWILLVSIIEIVLIITILQVGNKLDKKTGESKSNRKLHSIRAKDLTRLTNYLKHFEIVGLNSKWGTGKTYLIDELKERTKTDYEFIEIDIMTCNLNEMQSTLIKAFEKIIYKNRILPKYAGEISNKIESDSFFSKLQSLSNLVFTKSNSNAEIITEFQIEIDKLNKILNKKVVVIYEDIDRITNIDVIKEIFSISEKISNENIKILYQYDEKIMEELGFSEDYLEKYIPHKVSLTDLDFFALVEFELGLSENKILRINDFEFLREENNRSNNFSRFFKIDKVSNLVIEDFTFRRVKKMIDEITFTLKTKNKDYESYKQIVISFFLLKHIYEDVYKKLDIKKNLLEVFEFEIDSKKMNVSQLIDLYLNEEVTSSKIEEAFSINLNETNIGLLNLFKYKMLSNSENQHNIVEAHKNNKIDRIIWSLLFEGKSYVTDHEHTVTVFKEMVLSKPIEGHEKGYEDFHNYFYYKNNNEHKTIFTFLGVHMIELLESFKIANTDKQAQIDLIEFFFNNNKELKIGKGLIDCLNLCPLYTKEEFLTVLSNFSKLEVNGRLIGIDYFIEFLNKYIYGLWTFGFTKMRHKNGELIDFYKKKESAYGIISEILEDIKSIKKQLEGYALTKMIRESEVVLAFLNKILEVIENENVIYENKKQVKVEMTTNTESESVFVQITNLIKNGDNSVLEEIEKAYEENSIKFVQISDLLSEYKPKK